MAELLSHRERIARAPGRLADAIERQAVAIERLGQAAETRPPKLTRGILPRALRQRPHGRRRLGLAWEPHRRRRAQAARGIGPVWHRSPRPRRHGATKQSGRAPAAPPRRGDPAGDGSFLAAKPIRVGAVRARASDWTLKFGLVVGR
jgi:hypothetical protein